MQRVLSVYLPQWPIDLLKRRSARSGRVSGPRTAHLLIRQEHQCDIIAACCGRAHAQGVRPGMKLAHARSLITGHKLLEGPSRPEQDRAALRSLARWAVRFSPSVAPDPPDGLMMDVTGCERLYRGERRLAELVLDGIRRHRLHARVAIASTVGCAWAIARHGRLDCSMVPLGREKEALSPLPIAGLRIDPAAELALLQMNVQHIGEALALPRTELAARFGTAFLRRIDQAMGTLPEGIEALRPVTQPSQEIFFAGATTHHEAVERAAQELIEGVTAQLAQLESGTRELLLTLFRIDTAPVRLGLTLATPSRSSTHLWKLIRPRLERVNLGYGVEAMTLTAPRIATLQHEQLESRGLGGGHATSDQARAEGEFIDTLVSRMGAERVLEMEAHESHLPERACRMRMASTSLIPSTAAITPCDRPTALFEQPEPAEVLCLTPDGPVVSVRWRGESSRTLASLGPERITPEWWESNRQIPARDYFRVQDETGRWLWVFRTIPASASGAAWFVHGEWL